MEKQIKLFCQKFDKANGQMCWRLPPLLDSQGFLPTHRRGDSGLLCTGLWPCLFVAHASGPDQTAVEGSTPPRPFPALGVHDSLVLLEGRTSLSPGSQLSLEKFPPVGHQVNE